MCSSLARGRVRGVSTCARRCRRDRTDPTRGHRQAFGRDMSDKSVRVGHYVAIRRITARGHSSCRCAAKRRARGPIRPRSAAGFWRSAVRIHPDRARRYRSTHHGNSSAGRAAIAADFDVSLSDRDRTADDSVASSYPRPGRTRKIGMNYWRCQCTSRPGRAAPQANFVPRHGRGSIRRYAARLACRPLTLRSRTSSSTRCRRGRSRATLAPPAPSLPTPCAPHRPTWRPGLRRATSPRGAPGARFRA